MTTLAYSAYLDSQFGIDHELPRAGCALENPFVYDVAAQELKQLAGRGLIEITDLQLARRSGDLLIERLSFRRLR